MAQQNTFDVFSWDKFSSILDIKLKEIAKKDDLAPLIAEIQELKEENNKLKTDITALSNRLEQLDRKTRSANVIVSGIKSETINGAMQDFNQLCSDALGVNVSVVTARTLSPENTFLFTLETNSQAVNVLAAKKKLKGKRIFMQKDYTRDQQNVRYNLRTLNRNIAKHKKNIKIRMGEFCIFIDNKKYSWFKGNIVAWSNADAAYLETLLSDCNYNADIIVRDGDRVAS